jgi:glyoxylase-like metal-dependent hydrolase (beta-lactamase superfamily II)/rhodanese-related sulfurtransferase
MVLKQYYLGCLSQASYLIGDEATRGAAVVDPRRDVEEYLEDAAEAGLRIEHVILTHFHADFVAGHLELRERTGARIHLGARATAEYEFSPLADGDVIEFGQVRLKILETPGHTPEAISVLVFDLARDRERPQAVLTGDTLFIGDVGRPDLMASLGVSADDLAGQLYDSVHRLLELPDDTLLYPGHGAGSACGKNLSSETVSTIGAQRRENCSLQPMSKESFVKLVTTDQPKAPSYFGYDAQLNRRQRSTLEAALRREHTALPIDAVLSAQREGAQVLDVRDPDEYAASHLAGSVNVSLKGRFASWAGALLTPARPIVIVATPGSESEAALRLGRIGFDNVLGYLEGGIDAARSRPDAVRRGRRVTAGELAQAGREGPLTLIDVRFPGEWAQGAIPGALHIPLDQLEERLGEIPRGGRVAVYCQSGMRSSTAASLLEGAGLEDVLDLTGGYAAWSATADLAAPAR